MEMAEERAPQGFKDIHDVLSAQELKERADAFKKLAGFAVQSLNERRSYDTSASYTETFRAAMAAPRF